MKIVIMGGTGLIGSKLAGKLTAQGHDVVAAAPSTGIDSISGKGLAEALQGAEVVVDVTNSPSFAEDAVMTFFRQSTGNMLAASRSAGVSHYVALSVVGADRITDSPYLRAKDAQEQLIAKGGIAYTILRATQFFEFLGAIADSATQSDAVYLPSAKFQPVAAEDVAAALAEIATSRPRNGIVELAGPDATGMAKFIQSYLSAKGDGRKVIPDSDARYFGARLDGDGLAPKAEHLAGRISFADWIKTASA